jgi:ESCRT-II complex subunit VPS36
LNASLINCLPYSLESRANLEFIHQQIQTQADPEFVRFFFLRMTATNIANLLDGILTGVETSAQSQETVMQDAFQDLEALMIKARDMVRLAADLNERLTALSATTTAPSGLSDTALATLVPSTEPEEATFIRTSLSQLGLQMANAPVTLDMIKDEREWIAQLARELAGVLQGDGRHALGMMKARGIIALDEVWGGWNRARGVGQCDLAAL